MNKNVLNAQHNYSTLRSDWRRLNRREFQRRGPATDLITDTCRATRNNTVSGVWQLHLAMASRSNKLMLSTRYWSVVTIYHSRTSYCEAKLCNDLLTRTVSLILICRWTGSQCSLLENRTDVLTPRITSNTHSSILYSLYTSNRPIRNAVEDWIAVIQMWR